MARIYEYKCPEHGPFEKLHMTQEKANEYIEFYYCEICGEKADRKMATSALMESWIMSGGTRRAYKYADPRKKGLSTY